MSRKWPHWLIQVYRYPVWVPRFCKDLALQIQPVGWLLEIEGTGGSAIPYLGFVEVNLQIPGIRNYIGEVLLLVIPTTAYSEMVLVLVGSKIIDRAMSMMTKEELTKVTMMWQQAHFGAVMSGSLQLPCTSSNNWVGERSQPLLSKGWPCGGEEILPWWHQRPNLHHTEGHHIPVWHSKCAHKFQCQRTLWRSMCSWNWCQVPSCLQWWYQWQLMESYIWGPPGYLSVCVTWAPIPWKFPQRLWLDRFPLPTRCHQ